MLPGESPQYSLFATDGLGEPRAASKGPPHGALGDFAQATS